MSCGSEDETDACKVHACMQPDRDLRHVATCMHAAGKKSASCRNVHACSCTEVYVRMPQGARLQLDRDLRHAATCTLAAGQKSASCRNVHACSWTEVYVMPQRARLQLDRSLPSVIMMSCSCPKKPRVTQQSQRAKELLKRLHGSESV